MALPMDWSDIGAIGRLERVKADWLREVGWRLF
jgi:hypothetical protein